jgi:hypothetical protein
MYFEPGDQLILLEIKEAYKDNKLGSERIK